MTLIPATITTEVLEHADGRPVAYVDATAVAVFAYQEPDGTTVIDIYTREDIQPGRLRVVMDGKHFTSLSDGAHSKRAEHIAEIELSGTSVLVLVRRP